MIGELLRAYRQKNDITTRQLAPLIGISYATLNRIERGNIMDVPTWLKLQAWLLGGAKP